MTQDEIIEMAKKADLVTWLNTSKNFSSGVWWIEAHEPDDCLFKFAKLVAQHERERCVKLRDELHFYHFDKTASVSKAELVASVEQALDDYANLIRTGDV